MSVSAFPEIIYETPDAWGEPSYVDSENLNEIIADLRAAGGDDWSLCAIDDCTVYALVRKSGKYGLYRRDNTRTDEWRVFRNLPDTGYFEFVAQYFRMNEVSDNFPSLAPQGGTAPNASLILTADELAFIEERFGGSKSAAIHAALAALKRSE